MQNDVTLTPRIAIGTVEYPNGTVEIDSWEYELLRHTGSKITLWVNTTTVCICGEGQYCELCDAGN